MRWSAMLLALAGATVAALAQTNPPAARQLSLEDCIQATLERNLDLRFARYYPQLALTDLEAAYAGYNPNFSFGGTHRHSKTGGGFDPELDTLTLATTQNQNSFSAGVLNGLTPWGLRYDLQGNINETLVTQSPAGPRDLADGLASVSLTQPLLKNFWIDGTRWNIKVAKNQVKYSELTLKQTIMQMITTVEQAYYDLIYARENITVQEKAVELATQLVVENRKRVEVGALAPLDEKQAEAQAASTQAALIAARASLAVQQNTLKQMLTDDYSGMASVELQPTAPLRAPVHVFDRQISWSKGLTERPDLLQAKLDIERQGVTLKYTYNQLFPELDIVGGYGRAAGGSSIAEYSQAFNQIARGDQPRYYIGAQLTFPIGNTGARANYKRSKLQMEQYLVALKKLEQTIMTTIDNDIQLARSSYEEVGATRAAREYAAEALAAEQKKLENGKSTTYTVLQLQRDLTTARGNEIRALALYNKALAQLSLDEGATLERFGINLEME